MGTNMMLGDFDGKERMDVGINLVWAKKVLSP